MTNSPSAEVAANLRYVFAEAVRLVPSGPMKGDEAHHWELFITDTMVERVLAVLSQKDEKLRIAVEVLEKLSAPHSCCPFCYADLPSNIDAETALSQIRQ